MSPFVRGCSLCECGLMGTYDGCFASTYSYQQSRNALTWRRRHLCAVALGDPAHYGIRSFQSYHCRPFYIEIHFKPQLNQLRSMRLAHKPLRRPVLRLVRFYSTGRS